MTPSSQEMESPGKPGRFIRRAKNLIHHKPQRCNFIVINRHKNRAVVAQELL
jgi:hypothetical protein